MLEKTNELGLNLPKVNLPVIDVNLSSKNLMMFLVTLLVDITSFLTEIVLKEIF